LCYSDILGHVDTDSTPLSEVDIKKLKECAWMWKRDYQARGKIIYEEFLQKSPSNVMSI